MSEIKRGKSRATGRPTGRPRNIPDGPDEPGTLPYILRRVVRKREGAMITLSRRAGLSADGIRNILVGKSKSPRMSTVVNLAKVLNVPTDVLLGHVPLPEEFLDRTDTVSPPVNIAAPPIERAQRATMRGYWEGSHDESGPRPDPAEHAERALRRAVIAAVKTAIAAGVSAEDAVRAARRAAVAAGIAAGALDPEEWSGGL